MKSNGDPVHGDALFETLFDQAPVGIAVQGLDGRVLQANPAFCRMFGYERAEVTGAFLDEIVARDETLSSGAVKLTRKTCGGESISLETYRTRKDGTRFPVAITGAPIVKDGKVAAVFAIYEDVTDREKTEKMLERERSQFERIMLDSPDGIVIFDSVGKVLRANPAFERLFGLDAGQEIGHYLWEVVGGGPDTGEAGEVRSNIEKLKRENRIDHDCVRIRKDGTKIHVSVRGAAISHNGEATEFLAVYRDISDRKQAEESLAGERSYFEALFLNHPLAVVIANEDGVIRRINERFASLFGFSSGECLGVKIDELIAPGEVFKEAVGFTEKVAGGDRLDAECSRRKKDGTWIDVQIAAISFPGAGEERVVYAIYQDITERKRLEEHARYLGHHDSLTGLYNQAFLEEEIQRLDTPRQLPISVIMADLDNLKLINDSFGHIEGDRMIIESGNILISSCRREDIVARCGGDEFILLLPQTTLLEARSICDRIRQGCERERGSLIPPSIALGVAVKDDVTQDFMHIRKKADDNMYLDKLLRSDRSREAIFKRVLDTLESDRRRMTHINRLTKLAVIFGGSLALRQNEIEDLSLLGRFHDIGLMPAPEEIICKEGPLDPDELEMVRKHPERGYHIAKNLPRISSIAENILCHEERYDGSGYPRGLSGEDIPLHARIIHLLCAYEAMTGWRSCGAVLSKEEALEEIVSNAGTQFDPRLVGLFSKTIGPLEEGIQVPL